MARMSSSLAACAAFQDGDRVPPALFRGPINNGGWCTLWTRLNAFALAAFLSFVPAGGVPGQSAETLAVQREEYEAVRAKTVLELQPFRQVATAIDTKSGLHVTLISLNPAVGAWFLLQLHDPPDGRAETYHLENPDPAAQDVAFDAGISPALVVKSDEGTLRCAPWAEGAAQLVEARESRLAYAPLCEGRLYLRNPVAGSRTNIEVATDFLRRNVWEGEEIVRFVRDNFFKDSEVETSRFLGIGAQRSVIDGPKPMAGNVPPEKQRIISTLLDLGIEGAEPGAMTIGQWYPIAGAPGIFASAFQPRAISTEVLNGAGKTNRLDGTESRATAYMIAFDMSHFDIGFAVGTDHPALGWSSRPPASVRPRGLPGPDGIDRADPLVMLGMVNPLIADRTAATFAAGFKRQHGAFKFGDMAGYNFGHHYGFIEKGIILSKLQPGLSTLYGLTDGTIGMKTWTEADNALLPQIRFARQNGVPLIETDPETGQGVPGERVTQWGAGNWSGSAEAELRTLRAGACMASWHEHDYLVYGYFSTATPSAMARSFQAYGCNYAMLLDMNALEHTYLALYVARGGKMHVQHLMPGMALIEKKVRGGTIVPRFIGFADNRDFFYLTRKEANQ